MSQNQRTSVIGISTSNCIWVEEESKFVAKYSELISIFKEDLLDMQKVAYIDIQSARTGIFARTHFLQAIAYHGKIQNWLSSC